jgi:hypothetical protein
LYSEPEFLALWFGSVIFGQAQESGTAQNLTKVKTGNLPNILRT